MKKSTDLPQSEVPFGAVEFSLWKEIGEEFLLASSGELKKNKNAFFLPENKSLRVTQL